jgi:hypothetical protein
MPKACLGRAFSGRKPGCAHSFLYVGTERQCTEDENDDEDENDSQTSEFGFKTAPFAPPYR